MPKLKLWEQWEADVQERLGLRSTIGSGSKFYDISDGVTPEGHPIPLMVDAKSTEQKSYSLRHDFLDDWVQRAAEQGKMFGLPVRFENAAKTTDYMLVSFEDFETLWWLAQKGLRDGI